MGLREVKSKITQKKAVADWIVFLVLLLLIQSALLWMDHQPMFFFGDSKSYIWTAIAGWLPTDRSFVYGYFIHLVAVTTQSLTSLVIVQVLLLITASAVMAHLLIRYFRVRPCVAFIASLLTSLEPLQLLYTRYVMTETLALTIFVFYVWVLLHYLEYPQVKWLVVIQCIATLMISIRFAFIPLVWIGAFAIPVLALLRLASPARQTQANALCRMALHVVLSVLLLFVFTSAYKHIHGYLQHKPAAYSYDSGFLALSFVMPIVEPDNFPDADIGRRVLSDLDFPVKDRRARPAQRWMEGGVVDRLQKMEPDRMKADAIARQAALHAVIHNPLAFLLLGWHTFTDYFDRSYLQSCMETALGDRRLDAAFQKLITTRFNYPEDRSSALDLQTPTGRYFLHSGLWFQFLLFLPIGWGLLLVVLRDDVQRRTSLLLCLISAIFIGVSIFLVGQPTPRFLHIAAWLFLLMAGVGINQVFSGRQSSVSQDAACSDLPDASNLNIDQESEK